jgi:hypothetical protein
MSRYARPKGSRLLRGLWKLSKFVFLLVAVAALGLYGYVRYDYSSAAGHLAGATAQAESLGLPLLPQDLQMDPPVTDAQNAAPLYRQIHARWESRSKELQSNATRVALQAVYDQDAADLSAARKTLDGVADELRLASQAAQLPGVDYKRKWADGPFVILPEFKTYKDIVKRLSERSLLNAREGKLREALEDLRTASMVARHASSEPVLIAGLVHIACESIALNAARRIATLRAEDAQALRDLRACIGEFPAKPGSEHYLKGEVFFGYWTSLHLYEFVRRSRAELDYDMFSEPVPMIALTPPLFERDLVQKAHAATVLRYWLEAFTVGRSVDWEPREVGKRLDVMARQCELSLRPRDQALKVLFPVFASKTTPTASPAWRWPMCCSSATGTAASPKTSPKRGCPHSTPSTASPSSTAPPPPASASTLQAGTARTTAATSGGSARSTRIRMWRSRRIRLAKPVRRSPEPQFPRAQTLVVFSPMSPRAGRWKR